MLFGKESGVILPPNHRPVQVFSTATGTAPHFDVDQNSLDAIGRWRTHELVPALRKGGQSSRRCGRRPTERPRIQGPDEFNPLLVQGLDRFAEAFVEQLATFALRRVMTNDDASQIKAIALAAKKDGYKLRGMIESLVQTDLFQKC